MRHGSGAIRVWREARRLRPGAVTVLQLAALLAVAACADAGSDAGDEGALGALSFDEVGAAQLTFSSFGGRELQLVDGEWSDPMGGRERITLLPAYTAQVDIDGDGVHETVGLMQVFHLDYGEVYGLYSVAPGAEGPQMKADRLLLNDFELENFSVADGRVGLRTQRVGARGMVQRTEWTYRILNGGWELEMQRTLRSEDPS